MEPLTPSPRRHRWAAPRSGRCWPPVVFGARVPRALGARGERLRLPAVLPADPDRDLAAVHGQHTADLGRHKGVGLNALIGLVVGTALGVAMSFLLARFRLLNDLVTPLAIAAERDSDLRAGGGVQQHVLDHERGPAAADGHPRRLSSSSWSTWPEGLREVGPTAARTDALVRGHARSAILRKVRVPNAVPYLFTALKIAAPAAVITAFVSEYFGGSQNGLGAGSSASIAISKNAAAWAYVLGACLLGLTFYLIAVGLERVATPGGVGPAQPARDRVARRCANEGAMRPGIDLRSGPSPPGEGAAMKGNRFRFVIAGGWRRRSWARRAAATTATEAAPARRRRRAARLNGGGARRPTRSSCSCSGSSRPSSPATSPRRTRATTTDQCLDVDDHRGRRRHRAPAAARGRRGRLRLSWVPKALASREAGANIVDIAQVFQRSGTLQVSFKDKGITSPADFAGKTIGNWGFGNEYEIFAALAKAGWIRPRTSSLVQQQFDMLGLLSGDIDAAEAMTYNEYAQVLEAMNPDTGELYTPDDLNVVSYEDAGVGMLQDAIWADGGNLDDAAYRDIAVRSSRLRCRAGPTAGTTPGVPRHRRRQGLEARRQPPAVADERDQQADLAGREWRRLIDQAAWDRTVQIAMDTPNLEGATVLTAPPTDGAWTNDIVT